MRLFSVLVTLLLAAALTGCSGAKLSEKDYRAKLDKVCASTFEFTQDLPRRQQDEQLSAKQVRKLANREGSKFIGQVKELNPPDHLADADHRLTKLLSDGNSDFKDLDAIRAYVEDVKKAYEDVGAKGCVKNQQKTLAQLDQAASTG